MFARASGRPYRHRQQRVGVDGVAGPGGVPCALPVLPQVACRAGKSIILPGITLDAHAPSIQGNFLHWREVLTLPQKARLTTR
uniref:Uncharacterized protein n=1 Tax=Cupriavidus pinatubonensis (strain JMP 134 / LMG 1197) TaxID=264198 RepID=Q46QJ9_CUPPJ